MPTPRFPAEGLRFLKSLKRNNRREWFLKHRDDYEAHVKAPMLAILTQLADDVHGFAPELVVGPQCLYRIYRDVRFSPNKAPYKTHVAASFPTRGLPRHEGAGLYFHVSPEEVWIGGGMYAPQTAQLHAVREHIVGNLRRFRAIVESPAFKRQYGPIHGEQLQRVPRGFPKDHEAAHYLRFRQFLAGCELTPTAATTPRFYPAIVAAFKQAAPFIRFLNEPLLTAHHENTKTTRNTKIF
jgi:uncharacterized protein (TIGR02453 family)